MRAEHELELTAGHAKHRHTVLLYGIYVKKLTSLKLIVRTM